MFVNMKKTLMGQKKKSSPLSDSSPRPQHRPPMTPPLPLRTLQLVAKQPERPVVLRDRRKFKGQVSAVRESWPGAVTTAPESKPALSHKSLSSAWETQPITEAPSKAANHSYSGMLTAPAPARSQKPATSHSHRSVLARAPCSGGGSDVTIKSLLLFCQR